MMWGCVWVKRCFRTALLLYWVFDGRYHFQMGPLRQMSKPTKFPSGGVNQEQYKWSSLLPSLMTTALLGAVHAVPMLKQVGQQIFVTPFTLNLVT